MQACATVLERALPMMIDKLTEHIDGRLALLGESQRVNLNVRAPKRSSVHDPPIARNIAGAGRPFPLARFLDEKEREDPTWKGARRSLAPTFGMQMQVLKKKKLRDDGVQPIFVEQNHRPQLLYVESDRELMEDAWEMMTAHREDLVSRSLAPAALPAPAAPAVPRVLAMLQGA